MSISTGAAPWPSDGPSGRATAALAIGLTLLMFGIMFTFIGGILGGLCLIEGGILCEDTAIGSIGLTMLGFGLPSFVIGILLFSRGRWATNEATKAMLARRLAANPSHALGAVVPSIVRSECPHCGAPIRPGTPTCEWCGALIG